MSPLCCEVIVKIKRRILPVLFLAYAILFPVNEDSEFAASISAKSSGKIEIVCTTTHLSSIVDAVGGDFVETHTIIPYGMCPGHFDLSPGEARNLLEAKVLLCHGYEQFLKSVAFDDGTNKQQVNVKGNWMIPDLQVPAVRRIAEILSVERPDHADDFSRSAIDYTAAVLATADSLRNRLSGFRGIPVVCSAMNRDLIEWIGFEVIADYPRDEDMSMKTMSDIVTAGRNMGAKLVIDNRQSSGKIGRSLADNIGVPYIMLSNFPETDSSEKKNRPYIDTLIKTCASIIGALSDDGPAVGGGT